MNEFIRYVSSAHHVPRSKSWGYNIEKAIIAQWMIFQPLPEPTFHNVISIFMEYHSHLDKVFSPTLFISAYFLKVCLVIPIEEPAKGVRAKDLPAVHHSQGSGEGKALNHIILLPLPGSSQRSPFSHTFQALLKGWLDKWMPCLLTLHLSYLPQAGDTVLSFPQMQPKRPILKNYLSWSFILWKRSHLAVSTAAAPATICQFQLSVM